MNSIEMTIMVAILALTTISTRFLPFVLFPDHRPIPTWLVYLKHTLPPAAMGMLVVYALKDTNWHNSPYGLPQGLAVLWIIWVHQRYRNVLVSVSSGLGLFMMLAQWL